jgi:hypothetical protein
VFTIILINSVKAQENYLSILEPAIGLSQSELKLFLKGILKGNEPGRASGTQKMVYSIDNVDIHSDYYINDDSCLQAGMRFKNLQYYIKAEELIISNCPPYKGISNLY